MPIVTALESAVAPHLRAPGSLEPAAHRRPDFDSYTSRLDPSVTRIVIAYFGAQVPEGNAVAALNDLKRFSDRFASSDGPGHHELSSYTDEAGYGTAIAACYWLDPAAFDIWYSVAGRDWTSGDAPGHFVEVFRPTVRRIETLHSSDQNLQGLATLAAAPSGPIAEHGYWGGMRDRLPDARTDDLIATGMPRTAERDGVITVIPHDELCVIRSGQDYGSTAGDERAFYLEDVAPVLTAGMNFLQDDGATVGCISNRYLSVISADGESTDKTYAVSLWRDLSDLEAWAKSHPTHVQIFGAFMSHMKRFGAEALLRLYHEVLVVPAADQFFQYAHCHPDTGMLRARRLS